MLVVDVTIHIMDRKIPQGDTAAYALILCYYSHTCTIHFMRSAVAFPQNLPCPVCNLNIMDNHMLYIIQKHGGGHISLINMGGGIQRYAIVLIPDALPPGCNQRSVFPLLSCWGIRTNLNGMLFRPTVFNLQKLPCKNRIFG